VVESTNGEGGFDVLLAHDPDIARYARAVTGDGDGTMDPYLRARRLVEYELNAGPDGIPEWDFRRAAGKLRAAGHRDESDVLARIADTTSVLDEASREWHGRYLGRPPTPLEESDARLLSTGRVRVLDRALFTGCDGARYLPARLETAGSSSPLAVVVMNDAGAEEVVLGFRHEYAHDAWLSDRGIRPRTPGSGPLQSTVTGPWCRTAREELVLAFLMRGGDLGSGSDPGSGSGRLQARTFSTYLRSECFLACRAAASAGSRGPAGPGEPDAMLAAGPVRRQLERRMLRAPGWAADAVGWPFGNLALDYAARLSVTPVTAVQARAAARELIREDAIAARNAHVRAPARRAAWLTMRQQLPAPRPGPGPHLLGQRRPPDDRPPGRAPHP
jgi:hypothetical protein